MSAVITFNFAGGSATAERVVIFVQQGQFVLLGNSGFITTLNSAPTSILVVSAQIVIGTEIGKELQGTIAVAIDWSPQNAPVVILANMSNASVTWPTASGPQYMTLVSGEALQLNGIVASGT
jgi:hypothetical protein